MVPFSSSSLVRPVMNSPLTKADPGDWVMVISMSSSRPMEAQIAWKTGSVTVVWQASIRIWADQRPLI